MKDPQSSDKALVIALAGGGLAIGCLGVVVVMVAGIAWFFLRVSNVSTHSVRQATVATEVQKPMAPEPPPRLTPPRISEPELKSGPVETSPEQAPPAAETKERSIARVEPPPAEPRAQRPTLDLRYGWKTGDQHWYNITVKADVTGETKNVDAWCNYTVGQPALQGFEEQAGTGTAFVVAPDGYLITCAHVVEDAERLEVTLSGKKYEAQVVETDFAQDVALIRIAAQDLPALALADSDQVRQAQDIRVIGFPLSDVLGRDVKITSGVVSGFVDDQSALGKRFQIDAAINPGNSGGPVLNGQGQVIGVASAKLSGIAVTRVGFAVPANQARRLMQNHGIPPSSGSSHEGISGPELADAVKPAIALVDVTIGGGNRKRYQVSYSGGYRHKVEVSSRGPSAFFGPFGGPSGGPKLYTTETVNDQGSLRVSEAGEISEFQGNKQLPFVLGPIGLLVMEDLNHHGQSRWGSETQSELQIIQRSSGSDFPFGPLGPRGFGRDPFDPFGRRQEQDKVKESYPAVERLGYQLEKDGPDEVVINKVYEFRTLEDEENPYMLIKGSGSVKFDREFGMPKSLEYNATLQRSAENTVVRIPVSVAYVLRDPAEVAEERRKQQEELARLKAEAERKKLADQEAARVAATVPNPEKVTELIGKIQGKTDHWVYQQLGELSKLAVVEDRREEVVELASQYLQSSDTSVQNAAIDVIVNWGTKQDHVTILAGFLSNPQRATPHWSRPAMFKALGQHNDPQVIQVLATRLTNRDDSAEAQKALIAIGADAEDAVLDVLNNSPQHRAAAAKVLKEIGGEKSIRPLEQAELAEDNVFNRRDFKAAREAIQSRISPEPAAR